MGCSDTRPYNMVFIHHNCLIIFEDLSEDFKKMRSTGILYYFFCVGGVIGVVAVNDIKMLKVNRVKKTLKIVL